MPQKIFNKLQNKLCIEFHIDLMATSFNNKCSRYVTRQADSNATFTDFFTLRDKDLKNLNCYLFPPKNILTRTLRYVALNLTHIKLAIVFHKWAEMPLGLQTLQQRAVLAWQYILDDRTIVPNCSREIFFLCILVGIPPPLTCTACPEPPILLVH